MATIVALGDRRELEGFVLAGANVMVATSDTEIVDAWRRLDDEVGLVIMTGGAARLLEPELAGRPDVLTAVLT